MGGVATRCGLAVAGTPRRLRGVAAGGGGLLAPLLVLRLLLVCLALCTRVAALLRCTRVTAVRGCVEAAGLALAVAGPLAASSLRRAILSACRGALHRISVRVVAGVLAALARVGAAGVVAGGCGVVATRSGAGIVATRAIPGGGSVGLWRRLHVLRDEGEDGGLWRAGGVGVVHTITQHVSHIILGVRLRGTDLCTAPSASSQHTPHIAHTTTSHRRRRRPPPTMFA